jgi:hypothetical protein
VSGAVTAAVYAPGAQMVLTDVEPRQMLRILSVHLDVGHGRVSRPGTHERDHRLDRFRIAFEHGLDRALGRVAGPARDAAAFRFPARGIAEEDTLHTPMGDDSAALGRHVGTVDK